MKNSKTRLPERGAITRLNPQPDIGLTPAEAQERLAAGWANSKIDTKTKTELQIITGNLFTYFNLIFAVLAVLVILVGSFRDLTFMPVVIINTVIGIVQEIRSKRTLDKLSLLSEPKAKVVRGGRELTLSTSKTVIDDVALFRAGNQIYADAVLLDGTVQVNESMITGESNEITKSAGDTLLSGSFIVSGTCRARLDKVGRDSYVSKLTMEAKKARARQQSEMMSSLTKLVKWIGIAIIPFGLVLFYNQHYVLGLDVQRSVVATVGALVGMIPEGLFLLTTIALAVSVMRLAQNKTLVQDLDRIETLARIDVLCVDKTGTITEPKMDVMDTVLLCEDRFSREDVDMIMTDYIGSMDADNDTMAALKDKYNGVPLKTGIEVLQFSSALKYSGAAFADGEAYLLGAPERILESEYSRYSDKIEPYLGDGYRVLLLAMYDGSVKEKLDPASVMPVALVLLSNKVRKEAPATFSFFAKQGVDIKVISGDNPATVSNIAKKAGIINAEHYIDAAELDTDKKIREAVTKYTVFGRVTPEQKKKMVLALKAAGHKVAMTGDGVNDVMALKEADCSIAMASGSDAACRVSHLVLLNSNFGSMPDVVMEGRRVINNIERAAALFLVKNIFSFLLAAISMIAVLPYPVTAAQLSLVSMLTIGVPSFFLALEPNTEIVKGKFLRNVLFRAAPAGLTNVILVITALLFKLAFGFSQDMLSTISALILAEVGIIMLYRVCQPWSKLRRILWGACCAAVLLSVLFLRELFALSPLDFGGILILITVGLAALPVMRSISDVLDFFSRRRRTRGEKNSARPRRRKPQN